MDFETDNNESKKAKKLEKKRLRKEKIKKTLGDSVDSLQQNPLAFIGTVAVSIVLMFFIAWTVFFMTVRAPEQVMVPVLTGDKLEEALIKMQEKELYPKILLRYTDNPDDAGTVLNQDPDPGSIVKAGRRISLTVSRGAVVDHVGDYLFKDYDDVKVDIQTMFIGSSRPLIVLAEPIYKADTSPAGTILGQEPPEGTPISSPVTLKLVVSKGYIPDELTGAYPIMGMNYKQLMEAIPKMKNTYHFNEVESESEPEDFTVVDFDEINVPVPFYTKLAAWVTFPHKEIDGKVYGIFKTELPEYPYAVDMTLESTGGDGITTTLVSFKHEGGIVTVPYFVEKGSELTLSVAGKKMVRKTVD